MYQPVRERDPYKESAMPENYTLKVKIGGSEFSAEGPEDTVKDAFQQFLAALAEAGPSEAHKPDRQAPPNPEKREIPSDLLDRAFKREDDDVISLRILPPGEGAQRNADAAILLIYGFLKVLDMDHAPVMKLNEGLRRSGINLKRLDRFMDAHSGHYMKGGTRSGGRYTLTNTGEAWAQERLSSMFPNS
jgi:hypothetical protein